MKLYCGYNSEGDFGIVYDADKKSITDLISVIDIDDNTDTVYTIDRWGGTAPEGVVGIFSSEEEARKSSVWMEAEAKAKKNPSKFFPFFDGDTKILTKESNIKDSNIRILDHWLGDDQSVIETLSRKEYNPCKGCKGGYRCYNSASACYGHLCGEYPGTGRWKG